MAVTTDFITSLCTFSTPDSRKEAMKEFEDKFNVTVTPRFFAPIPPQEDVKNIYYFFMSMIMVIGLISNIAVILWIAKRKTKHTNSDAYIITLSVGDLLTVFTRIPLHVDLLTKDFNFDRYSPTDATLLCRGGTYLQTASLCVSLFALIVIALDRYVAICHPLFHYSHVKGKRIYTAIATASIWVLGGVVGIRDCLEMNVSTSNFSNASFEEYHYESQKEFVEMEVRFELDVGYYRQHNILIPLMHESKCDDLQFFSSCTSRASDDFIFYLFALVYVLPLSVMAFCYISVVYRLWIRRPIGVKLDNANTTVRAQSAKKRNTICMITLVATFGVLWLPFWVRKLSAFSNLSSRDEVSEAIEFDHVDFAANIISYLPILSTPIIYLIMDRGFKKMVKDRFSQLTGCRIKICCKEELKSNKTVVSLIQKASSIQD